VFLRTTLLYNQGFLRCFRDPIRVHRIENRVPRIRENYRGVPRIRENRVPRIREIGSLQVHTRYLTFIFKKTGTTVLHHSFYSHVTPKKRPQLTETLFCFGAGELPLDVSRSMQMKKLLEVKPMRHPVKIVQRFEGPLLKVCGRLLLLRELFFCVNLSE